MLKRVVFKLQIAFSQSIIYPYLKNRNQFTYKFDEVKSTVTKRLAKDQGKVGGLLFIGVYRTPISYIGPKGPNRRRSHLMSKGNSLPLNF